MAGPARRIIAEAVRVHGGLVVALGLERSHPSDRPSSWPRLRARLVRMRSIQVRREERPSNRGSPLRIAIQVSWTTSSAIASDGTKSAAIPRIELWYRATSSPKAASSCSRSRSSRLASGSVRWPSSGGGRTSDLATMFVIPSKTMVGPERTTPRSSRPPSISGPGRAARTEGLA